ncbi:MAG: polysaccharide deacetylase family protein [Bryobacterales bacterium]|nr:polysaccharide deacetylase family protein [Bryobacterales bacterium]
MNDRTKAALKECAVQFVDKSGFSRLIKPFFAGCGAILGFHRVLPEGTEVCTPGHVIGVNQLRAALAFARRSGWRFIALDEIPDRLSSKSRERFLALTLDDGYLDNLVHGAPVFEEFDAPFALFPYTNALDRAGIDFWMLLQALLLSVDSLQVDHPAHGRQVFETRTMQSKRDAVEVLFHLSGPREATYQAVLAASARAGLPMEAILDRDFLSWDQLRTLAANPRVTIGVHTVSHANLAALSDEGCYREISEAKARLESRLGTRVRHIAYPFGSPSNCRKREFDYARELGFVTGVTTTRGNVFPRHSESLLTLPRHLISGVKHSADIKYLRMSLNGVWDTPLNNKIVRKMQI